MYLRQFRAFLWLASLLTLCGLTMLTGCGGGSGSSAVTLTIKPNSVGIKPGTSVGFTATVTGSKNTGVTWKVQEGSAGGTIDSRGKYTAPNAPGVYHIIATSNANTRVAATATAAVVTILLEGIVLGQAGVVSGSPVLGTVVISDPAPDSGLVVPLKSDNPAAASVPDSVTIPAGQKTVAFVINTTTLIADTTVNISATLQGFTQSSPLKVASSLLSTLTLNPSKLNGGATSTGTITLSGTAPAGGFTVALSSSNSALAAVPANVVVPAGASSANFNIATSPVGTNTFVTISGALGGANRSAVLNLLSGTLASISLTSTTAIGGVSVTGTVALTEAAPAGGALIGLTSNIAAATVPASVTVPAGATTATFTILTSPVALLARATIAASYNLTTLNTILVVQPPIIASLALTPSTIQGGNPVTGTITLIGVAPTGGTVVTVSSSNAGVAQVPANVVVPEGTSTVTFTVTTVVVSSSKTLTIRGATGGVSITSTLTVTP